jgi:hypothetical protein
MEALVMNTGAMNQGRKGLTPNQKYEKSNQPAANRWYATQFPNRVVDRSGHCRQFDLLLGNDKVEEKFIRGPAQDWLIVELIQDVRKNTPGWFYETAASLLMWRYCDPAGDDVIYQVSFARLRPFVIGWMEEDPNQNMKMKNTPYSLTMNLPIPWKSLEREGIAVKHIVGGGK